MGRSFLGLSLALASALLSGPAGGQQNPDPSHPDPRVLAELGLAEAGGGWVYGTKDPVSGKETVRRLADRERDEVFGFLRAIPPQGLVPLLAKILTEELASRGVPTGGHPWFEADGPLLRPSGEGKRAVAGIWLSRHLPHGPAEPASPPTLPDEGHGPLPVDRAGVGRAAALPGEGASVLFPGERRFELLLVAANFVNEESNDAGSIEQNYETHTAALGLRQGIRAGPLPAMELGAQVQVHRRDRGFLDGFIEGFERNFAKATGHEESENPNRQGPEKVRPGYRVEKDGRTLRSQPGNGAAIGDVRLTAKAGLLGRAPEGLRLALRLALNLGTGPAGYSRGSYLGMGAGVRMAFSRWLSSHLDLRVSAPLGKKDDLGLPLRPVAFGSTTGLEFRLGSATSLGLQVDTQSSPYRKTGLASLDSHYGGFSIGMGRDLDLGGPRLLLQAYGRENFEIRPFRITENSDPDFSAGLLVSVD